MAAVSKNQLTMKRIFLESHNLKNKYSGFGQFNFHLIKALSRLDTPEIQFTIHVKDTEGAKKDFGSDFVYKKYRSITRHKPFRIKTRYDLWHSLNQNIKIEPFFKIPYLLTVHDIHFLTEGTSELQQKLRAKFTQKLERSNAIVYISEFAKLDMHRHFKVPEVPEYVIYNGNTITDITLPETYRPAIIPHKPFLFSIGDFTERKNFISLVEMLRLMPEHQLVLSGNNRSIYADKLSTLAESYGLQDRVLQTGKIDDIEKQYYLKNCEAFVFPSLREGFGIPPIEAMRFGKPVFMSNNTSLPEIGGEHAFYWDHYDPQYMVEVYNEGMKKFNSDPSFYQSQYVARAKSFNWDHTARQYLEVYKKILK
jgi:glycosyltransferase involved in cell wall biosynthesis